jgi:antitoxin HicB
MLAYPITLETDAETGAVIVNYVDFPSVHTSGDSKETALFEAVDGLETAMMMLMTNDEPIPQPSFLVEGQVLVRMSILATAKVALYIEMKKQGIRKVDMCLRCGLHKQQLDRLLDLKHNSKIEALEQAIKHLGKTFVVDVV